MLYILKTLARSPASNNVLAKKPFVRFFRGGMPGCNLPWGMDSPMRFTAFYLLAGVIGYGAPWLVIMHQMLRPYDYVVD